jgi:hypothetical protein
MARRALDREKRWFPARAEFEKVVPGGDNMMEKDVATTG